MPEPIRLTAAARDAMREHAEREYPHECCGMLVGSGRRVEQYHPARNTVTGLRLDRYDMHPADILAAESGAAAVGLEILGFVHSHPDHPAIPSEHDREKAWEDHLYLIAEVRRGSMVCLRAWELDNGGFDETALWCDADMGSTPHAKQP